jgi:methyl-accepting chemotaxis protein
MKSLKSTSLTAVLALAALNCGGAAILFRSASAQRADSLQINLAGAQRMLSQRMTKEALLANLPGNSAALAASVKKFDKVLRGLAAGDAELQLPGTREPEILAGLAGVTETWAPIRSALEKIAAQPDSGRTDDAALSVVIAGNMDLLTRMDAVVKLFERRAQDKVDATLRLHIGITFILVGLLFGVWLITLRAVIRPLISAVDYVGIVSSGDLTAELAVEFRIRRDEIGALARAMQAMSSNLRAMIAEISGKTGVVLSSSTDLQANAARMSSGSRDAGDRAHSVAAAAEQMSVNVTSVAAGMEQTTTNLEHVSRATLDMTATIGAISGKSEQARRITTEATRQATNATEQIGRLGRAANEIGKVTEMITEISAQTNLLALNATIEAARAGAAGKGFAVVANEIKALAAQTATATDDIRSRIDAIQSASSGGAAEVDRISHVIGEVSDIVGSIIVAIEEQAGVTESIARSIAEANLGVKDANARMAESSLASRSIAADIAGVDRVAGDMTDTSEQVRGNAVELASVSE